MSGRISKTRKRKGRHGIEILRFRTSTSSKEPKHHRLPKFPKGALDLSHLQSHNLTGCCASQVSGMVTFAATSLPKIPEPPIQLQQLLRTLKSSEKSDPRHSKTHKPSEAPFEGKRSTKTKLNGFMAFRTFYSRDISTVEHQRSLSSTLADVWASDPEMQLIWQRYATEYNIHHRENPTTGFITWLHDVTGSSTSSRATPTPRGASMREARVENIYLDAAPVPCSSSTLPLSRGISTTIEDKSESSSVQDTQLPFIKPFLPEAHEGDVYIGGVNNIDPEVYNIDQISNGSLYRSHSDYKRA